jgi:hypothetical protein
MIRIREGTDRIYNRNFIGRASAIREHRGQRAGTGEHRCTSNKGSTGDWMDKIVHMI